MGLASVGMLASERHSPSRMDGPFAPQSTTIEPGPATQEKCSKLISWWLRHEGEKEMTAVAMAHRWLLEFHIRKRSGHIASKQELLIALASTRVLQLSMHEKHFERVFGSSSGSSYQEMMVQIAKRENQCLADRTIGSSQNIAPMSSAAKTVFVGFHLTQLTKDLSHEVFDLTPTTREEKFDRREFLELLRRSEFMALPPVEKIIISYALQHAVKVDNLLSNNSEKRHMIDSELSKVGISATTQHNLDLWKAGRLATIWHRSEVRREFLLHQKDQDYRWI
ncbi:Homocysteine synthase [Venturia nashicola]|uniref:Homocysteine synthase n=1 Tax=Venturia nashicola TaxID=86259 RepID=A0A4Z1NVD7_9PEZI|nr:Homocysteine synthase [Venturia nashicola]